MTKQLQQTLRDSKVARWMSLIIVSLTMMMAYFFTDVMGPLEAPLTTKGKLVYFEDGTYLSADSLTKVSLVPILSEEEIVVGNTYKMECSDSEGNVTLEIENKGFSLVEVISTCPTNWGMTPTNALKWLEDNMLPYYPLGVYKDITAEKEAE